MTDAISTNRQPIIRPLTFGDLPRVMAIEQTAFTTPWKLDTFEGLLVRKDTDLIGAVHDDELVGYAVCWTVADQAELGNVAVDPERRRTGTGRLLVRTALDRVRERGAGECFLEVRASNEVAQNLYRAEGFELIGRRRRYYTNPVEDALVMRVDLK